MSERPSGGRFETFDANARFVVVRDDQGYGVWRLDDRLTAIIERFSDDDRGPRSGRSVERAHGQRSP